MLVPLFLGCSPQQPANPETSGSESQLMTLLRVGGYKKYCKFQINCKFNDCVDEYLISHIFHEYA